MTITITKNYVVNNVNSSRPRSGTPKLTADLVLTSAIVNGNAMVMPGTALPVEIENFTAEQRDLLESGTATATVTISIDTPASAPASSTTSTSAPAAETSTSSSEAPSTAPASAPAAS